MTLARRSTLGGIVMLAVALSCITQPVAGGTCAGDVNGDGSVNVEDLVQVILNWGPCPDPCPPICKGDLNGDCKVDELDMALLEENWLKDISLTEEVEL